MISVNCDKIEEMVYYIEVIDADSGEKVVMAALSKENMHSIQDRLGFKSESDVKDSEHRHRVRESVSGDGIVDIEIVEYYIKDDEMERVREILSHDVTNSNRSTYRIKKAYMVFGKIPSELLASKYKVNGEGGYVYRLTKKSRYYVGYAVDTGVDVLCRHRVEMYIHEYLVCTGGDGKVRLVDCNVNVMILRYQYIAFMCGMYNFLIDSKQSLNGWEVDHKNCIHGMDNASNLQVIRKADNIKRYYAMLNSGEIDREFEKLGMRRCMA